MQDDRRRPPGAAHQLQPPPTIARLSAIADERGFSGAFGIARCSASLPECVGGGAAVEVV